MDIRLGLVYESSKQKANGEQGQILEFDSSRYQIDKPKVLKSGQTNFYWHCDQKDTSGCKARATTCVFDATHHRILKLSGEHSHEVSCITTQAKRVVSEISSRARNTADRMVDIVNSARIDVPIVVQQALPNKQNLMRNGHRARQVANGFPAPPETLEELVIPEEFQNVTMRDPNGGPK